MSNEEWLDEREQRAWRGFYTMQRHLRRRLNQRLQRHSGLSEADYAVLVALSEAPGGRLRAFQLATVTQWEKSRLHHQLGRMVDRGLVVREPCPEHPRGSVVALSEAGRDAIVSAAPLHVADVRRHFVDLLTPAQLDAVAEISETVLAVLDGAPDEGADPLPATERG
ncbi:MULTISPECIES: MarR family winged helix-turn-helix transcriptional regulator [Actinoalloteichus]|uniref:Transcriptional regulator, MarR family n=2 Tax=Actinoalloteichus cyanogriseus TaxID=2893586 RepID=A0ABT1JLU1_ACTCY|nr:MarR family winged helix-turn-helix transcriptional regulator [Actinoalloteichus caeruleus]MCP2333480.1 transcriptional regulator, MarR family [Actinoalloteichus caeruleus DSM 43889]